MSGIVSAQRFRLAVEHCSRVHRVMSRRPSCDNRKPQLAACGGSARATGPERASLPARSLRECEIGWVGRPFRHILAVWEGHRLFLNHARVCASPACRGRFDTPLEGEEMGRVPISILAVTATSTHYCFLELSEDNLGSSSIVPRAETTRASPY